MCIRDSHIGLAGRSYNSVSAAVLHCDRPTAVELLVTAASNKVIACWLKYHRQDARSLTRDEQCGESVPGGDWYEIHAGRQQLVQW